MLRTVLENVRNQSLIGQGEQHLLCNKGFYQKDPMKMFRSMLSCSIGVGIHPALLWMTTTTMIMASVMRMMLRMGYGCHDDEAGDKADANDPCNAEHTAGGAARHGLPWRQSISSNHGLW